LALPSGWQPGDFALVWSNASAAPYLPTNDGTWTPIYGFSLGSTEAGYHVLAAGDGTLTFGTSVKHVVLAIYHGVAGVGGFQGASGSNNWSCALAAGMTVTNGSSWIACIGGQTSAGINVPNTIDTPAFAGTVGRSQTFTDPQGGLADTNGGVSAWPGDLYNSGSYVSSVWYGIELEST